MNEAFETAIRKASARKAITWVGEVVSIDGDTCTVSRSGGLPNLIDVRLNALSGTIENWFVVYPKIGSKVLCLEIENQPSETAIVKFTEVDKIDVKIEGAEFVVEAGKFKFKNQQADLKQILATLLETLNNATITTPSGPGFFSPTDKTVFVQQKQKTEQLFE